jgi:predicted membrane metal-binding protein
MLELAAVVMTIGAMLYRLGGFSLYTIGYIGLAFAVVIMTVLRSRQGIIMGLLAGCVLSLGALAVWRIDTPLPESIFGNRAFDARVVSVDRRLEKTNIIVVDTQYDQKLQLTTRGSTSVLPGDTITVRGVVERPEDFTTDTGRVFQYRAYLESKGIVGLAAYPIIGPVTARSFSVTRIPTIIRYRVADIFSRYVTFPFDGVLAGMIVGYQGGLPSEVQDLFRNTGVLHVLVLS